MKTSAALLEEEHKKQMSEALENLRTIHDAHKKDMAQAQDIANQQSKICCEQLVKEHHTFLFCELAHKLCTIVQQELKVLEKTIQEKNIEIKRLQKQNAELEREKHTEVVKLRLEVYKCT